MEENITSQGVINLKIEWDDGRVEHRQTKNRILRSGRINFAKSLANDFGATYEYFISGMSFGSGGTVGGAPRYIDETREGLFGPTVITKGVIASINAEFPTQVIFTSVVTFEDAAGEVINEMALKMRNGDFFSMATFGDINKTSSMQLLYNWSINLL